MGDGFPIDLVLFGMVAVFLVLRLVSILGKRTGFERPTERVTEPGTPAPGPNLRVVPPVIDAVAEPQPTTRRIVPESASPTGQALQTMTALDRSFDPSRFLDGAEAAFRIIVTAFAAGDRPRLHGLLSEDTYRAFEGAISGRETAGETQRTEIRGLHASTIEHAELHGTVATITVKFVSDQVNVTIGPDGNPVAGADAVTEITDIWSFERDLQQTDPAWRLVAARSA